MLEDRTAPTASALALTSSLNSSPSGQDVTLTAVVSPLTDGGTPTAAADPGASGSGAPTGTVTFSDGDTVLGSAPLALVNGQDEATLDTAGLAPGSHAITAAYGGDATFDGSSGSLTQAVLPAATWVALASSLVPATVGQDLTFTATVAPAGTGTLTAAPDYSLGVPGGSVTFYDGDTALGTVALAFADGQDQAALDTASLPEGVQSITAVYGGDATFAGSSAALSQAVQPPTATGLALTSSAAASLLGTDVIVTASVSSSGVAADTSFVADGGLYSPPDWTPSGTVTFFDGDSALGTVALDGQGQAALDTTSLAPGSHTLTATYGGDDTFAGSSATLAQLVLVPPLLTSPGDQSNVVGDLVALPVSATAPAGDALLYGAWGLPPGLGIDPDTGAIAGTLAPSAVAGSPYAVTVTATDSSQPIPQSAGVTFSWAVGYGTPSPWLDNPGNQTNTAGDVVNLRLSAGDGGGYALSFRADGLPAGLALDPSSGAIRGGIAASAASPTPYTVTLTASDGYARATQTLSWTIGAIRFTNPGDQRGLAGAAVTLTVSATDATGAALSYGATGLPPGLSMGLNSGAITGIIAGTAGAANPYAVTLTATDGTYTAATSFNWQVDALALANPGPQYSREGDTVTLQLSATDLVGTPTFGATGLAPGLSIDPARGLIYGTIPAGAAAGGPYWVTLTATDSAAGVSQTFPWAVTATTLTASGGSTVAGDGPSGGTNRRRADGNPPAGAPDPGGRGERPVDEATRRPMTMYEQRLNGRAVTFGSGYYAGLAAKQSNADPVPPDILRRLAEAGTVQRVWNGTAYEWRVVDPKFLARLQAAEGSLRGGLREADRKEQDGTAAQERVANQQRKEAERRQAASAPPQADDEQARRLLEALSSGDQQALERMDKINKLRQAIGGLGLDDLLLQSKLDFQLGVLKGFVKGISDDISGIAKLLSWTLKYDPGLVGTVVRWWRGREGIEFFAEEKQAWEVGQKLLKLKMALEARPIELLVALVTGDEATLDQFGTDLKRGLMAAGDLVVEALTAAINMPAEAKGEVAGQVLWIVVQTLLTEGAAAAVKAGRLTQLRELVEGWGIAQKNPRVLRAFEVLVEVLERGAGAGKAAKAAGAGRTPAEVRAALEQIIAQGGEKAKVAQRALRQLDEGVEAGKAGQKAAEGAEAAAKLARNCFAAGTPLLTPWGDKAVEQFKAGDRILSRPESNVDAELEVKQVEEVFVGVAPVLNVHVAGRVIRVTGEHPFYALGRGWVTARELAAGDKLSTHEGRWVAVEAVTDSGEVATVYNLRVADYHTYFVGARAWGFSVWAHNTTCGEAIRQASGMAKLTDEQLAKAVELLNKRSTRAATQELERLGVDVNNVEVRKLIAQNSRYADLRGERPRLSPAQRQKVWDDAKDFNGKVFDRTTNPPTELSWDKSKGQFDQWQMGHLPEKSYQQLHQRFMSGEISYQEFLNEVRNSANYFPQAPTPNMGRHLERGKN